MLIRDVLHAVLTAVGEVDLEADSEVRGAVEGAWFSSPQPQPQSAERTTRRSSFTTLGGQPIIATRHHCHIAFRFETFETSGAFVLSVQTLLRLSAVPESVLRAVPCAAALRGAAVAASSGGASLDPRLSPRANSGPRPGAQ